MYIDTHCHIDDEKFTEKQTVISEMASNFVDIAINMGVDTASSVTGKELAEKYDSIYFACGFHPSEIERFDKTEEEKIIGLLQHEKCVAVGEIGLDYHFLPFDKKKQIDGFIRQIEIAKQNKLPFTVHSRDATEDTLNILKQNKDKLEYGAVMHCFSGSTETAKEYVKLGIMISFGGTVTFKNAVNLREVAKIVPIDFLLTETDSPYLAPEPERGKINQPKNVAYILNKLANIRGEDPQFLAERVMKNAKRVFYKIK